jgi:hypothetical protein
MLPIDVINAVFRYQPVIKPEPDINSSHEEKTQPDKMPLQHKT